MNEISATINSNRPILLIEDDEVDIMTVQRAVKEIKITNPMDVARNGEEGLEYLTNNPAPCIILLDINMPKMNGIEFLREIKANDQFKKIPVIILTTSREEQDRLESFELSAAGYMIKPVDYKKFVELIRTINLYWSLSQHTS